MEEIVQLVDATEKEVKEHRGELRLNEDAL